MTPIDITRIEESKAEVFVALIEVAPEDGCGVDSQEVAGAFARCYFKATNSEAALAAMTEALQARMFRVVGIQWCVRSGDVDWEDPDNDEAEGCLSVAEESPEVLVGRLDTWASGAKSGSSR